MLRFWRKDALLEHPGVSAHLRGQWAEGWHLKQVRDGGGMVEIADLPPAVALHATSDPLQLALLHRPDQASRWWADLSGDAAWSTSDPAIAALDPDLPGRLVPGPVAGKSVRVSASYDDLGEARALLGVYRQVCHLLVLGRVAPTGAVAPLAGALMSARDAARAEARLAQGVTGSDGRVVLWLEGEPGTPPDLYFEMVHTARPTPAIFGRPVPAHWSGRATLLRGFAPAALGSADAPYPIIIDIP